MNGIILICPLLWTPIFQTRYTINRWFWYLSTLVDTTYISSRHLYERHHLNVSTLVDTSPLFALHIRILISAFVHFSGHSLYIITAFILTRYLNLSTLVDAPLLFYSNTTSLLSRTLLWEYSYSYLPTDRPLLPVHFSGHTFTSFDIYLSVFFQFVHFSGHPSFSCITWQNIDFSTCPL